MRNAREGSIGAEVNPAEANLSLALRPPAQKTRTNSGFAVPAER